MSAIAAKPTAAPLCRAGMIAVMDDADPLPENRSSLDSIAVFYEYAALCRRQWLAGELDLPPMFRPRPTGAPRE